MLLRAIWLCHFATGPLLLPVILFASDTWAGWVRWVVLLVALALSLSSLVLVYYVVVVSEQRVKAETHARLLEAGVPDAGRLAPYDSRPDNW